MRTLQEIFDTAYLGLIAQGAPAVDSDYSCKYRTPDGLKCAVGMLIADEHYKQDFENVPVRSARTREEDPLECASMLELGTALERSGIDLLQARGMLVEMQRAHDEYARKLVPPMPFVAYIRDAFAAIAARHHLTVPEG